MNGGQQTTMEKGVYCPGGYGAELLIEQAGNRLPFVGDSYHGAG